MNEKTDLKDVFVWSSRFETGLHDVDQQHTRLVQLINSLSQLAIEGSTQAKLISLLDELQDYAGYHFKTEEDLMAQFALNADFVASHVHAHASLREQIRIVRNLAESAESSAGAAVGRLLPFLTKWLMFHVLGTDMRMAHEIIALQRGESREQAEEQALAQQSESLVIVLDALNEITDNLTRRTTELQESNQRLRISEARYALAQRAARIGSWDLNLESNDLRWSDEVDPLFGFRLRDFSQPFEGFMACVHPEDRTRMLEALDAVRQGSGDFSVQTRIVWADGTVRWLAITGECIRGRAGEADRIVGIVRDITDEKLAREQLQDTNAQLKLSLASVERHAADLTRLNELNEGLQSCLNASEAFEVVEHTLGRLNLGSGGALAVQPIGEEQLKTVVRWGESNGMSAVFAPSACWGMRRNQRHTLLHLADGPACKHFDNLPGSPYLCHPLQVLGENLGLLTVSAPADVSEREWARISHLSAMVAESLKLALSNVRLREALHEQAIRDPLTGLLNRRYLDETLPREIVRAQREHRPISLVMLDLDHFKHVNDTWGHEAGDAVLVNLAAMLRLHLRSSDLACRFGGEEFVVVMPGATLVEARERIEQIARRVRETPIQLAHITLPAVTFSAGLVQTGVHGDTAEALLRAADHALYAAKEAGRDRIHEPAAAQH
ncbi:diguanylate cyclase [Uliginosibacterium sp. 31-16]|uniref:diguanylate cyclase n=1 Tax=Uliginosibacterium sp. 31-16 TaxID=3068315 RepID=UPI00273FF524|nr:diguanylate cyclase [Uliginosibacterium sp. 31-16]MDP5238968.1 diguanylate cyclase [Uliginosibacterium sp. 31-16]